MAVQAAVEAAEEAEEQGVSVRVINMHTIKPIDKEAICAAVKDTGALVTAEEHQVYGGLGSAVAEVLAKNCPSPLEMVAVQDSFGETGKPQQLLEKYHLKDVDIAAAAKRAIKRKM